LAGLFSRFLTYLPFAAPLASVEFR
jgi:hypothetical protein